jgi:hypothetical protein
MSTNRNLLKEAIADAKTIKETAIANAKAVLEESFAPQMRSLISLKLQEMATEEEEYDPLADINEVEKGPFYHIYNFIRYYIS